MRLFLAWKSWYMEVWVRNLAPLSLHCHLSGCCDSWLHTNILNNCLNKPLHTLKRSLYTANKADSLSYCLVVCKVLLVSLYMNSHLKSGPDIRMSPRWRLACWCHEVSANQRRVNTALMVTSRRLDQSSACKHIQMTAPRVTSRRLDQSAASKQ